MRISDLLFYEFPNMLKLFLRCHISSQLIFLDIFNMADTLPLHSHSVVSVSGHQIKLIHEETTLLSLKLVEILHHFF